MALVVPGLFLVLKFSFFLWSLLYGLALSVVYIMVYLIIILFLPLIPFFSLGYR